MRRFIRVQLQLEGIHRWKECPFSEVAFLQDWHRHMFFFDVKISVEKADRELEFILVKRTLIAYLKRFLFGEPTELSCEQMAEFTVDAIITHYGERSVEVWVYEDGENGGGVIYDA